MKIRRDSEMSAGLAHIALLAAGVLLAGCCVGGLIAFVVWLIRRHR